VEYEPPEVIIEKIESIEQEIQQSLKELNEMLQNSE